MWLCVFCFSYSFSYRYKVTYRYTGHLVLVVWRAAKVCLVSDENYRRLRVDLTKTIQQITHQIYKVGLNLNNYIPAHFSFVI